MKKLNRKNLKQVGIIRPIDNLGRIVVPMEFREIMGAKQGDSFEQSLCKDENDEYVLVIRKHKED